jgi:hypothetical protein
VIFKKEKLKNVALMYQAYKCDLLEAWLNEARMQWIDQKARCNSDQRAVRNKRNVAASSKISSTPNSTDHTPYMPYRVIFSK